jgi:hypothetical protein
MSYHLRVMFFLWQFGLVDTYTMVHYFTNTDPQYAYVVVTSAAGNFSEFRPNMLLKTGYLFLKAAETSLERHA